MKRYIIAIALLASGGALAQSTNSPAVPSAPGAQPQQGGGRHFEEAKSRHLERIAHRIAELQQVQSCIQAATNHDALRACRPQHHE